MFILDDFQEGIGEANLLNGFDLNTRRPERARDPQGDAARPEGVRARLLDGLDAEPRQRHGRDPSGLERGHRQRPQPGRRPRELQVRDVQRGRAGRHRPDVHPGHVALAGHGDDVHRLAARARERRPQRRCGTATRSRSTAAARRSPSSSRRSRRSTSTSSSSATAGSSTGSTTPTTAALWNQIWTEVKAT